MCATRSMCLAGISGNLRRSSRTRALVEHLGRKATRDRNVTFALYDLIDSGPGLGAEFTRETRSSRAAATAACAGDQDFAEYRLVDSAVIERAGDAASQHNVAIGSRPVNLRGRTKGLRRPGISSYEVAANTAVLRQSSYGGVS
jgi:NAD(P)H-dependent FMN reductase